MTAVARLVTLVEFEDHSGGVGQVAVSARHEAVLVDGQRILLLDDRGWTSGPLRPSDGAPVGDAPIPMSVTEVEADARAVVGPDEPMEGSSQEDAEAAHWAYLTGVLRHEGVIVDPLELRRLPHDVVLGERLLARICRDPGDAVSP
jgi:hypothetical protein